ncbi:hypothetical protein FHE66_06485 [Georgenia sp. 311]|uniref:type IV toxin-antitoxin system AbiEi family antitoxin domain-containing protein n=1 Tax=Georgenia sp. 311 TaxID=2585134 RepID=UPI001112657C|nr:hypothetical protein [Georgenia sp. 311]TNC18436.1 hypothetical protein FHE66_06485 [Georgenia sp. 311]
MGLVLDPPELPPIVVTSGLDAKAVRAMVRAGGFDRVRRGALTPRADGGWQAQEREALARIAAVSRKLTNGAVVSHSSAALLHGLWLYRVPTVVHVTQRARANGHGAPDLRRHRGPFGDSSVTVVHGIRVSTIERTVVECARTMHPRDALVVADSALRALVRPDRFDREPVADHVAELKRRLTEMVGHGRGHGRRRARAVIAAADPFAESPMESVVRWVAVSRGLPTPTVQLEVRTRGGTFYADLGWEWTEQRPDGSRVVVLRVLVEYDGELKYLPELGLVRSHAEASAALVAEKRREDLVREDGVTRVLRVTRTDLRDPDALAARLVAALPASVRRTLDPVPELVVPPHTRLI